MTRWSWWRDMEEAKVSEHRRNLTLDYTVALQHASPDIVSGCQRYAIPDARRSPSICTEWLVMKWTPKEMPSPIVDKSSRIASRPSA